MSGAANTAYLKGKADPYEEKDKDKWSGDADARPRFKTRTGECRGYSIGTVANVAGHKAHRDRTMLPK